MNKQYCVYCSYMICGDANYCEKHKKCLSDNAIKSVNKCKDFAFVELNALTMKTYKSREKKAKTFEQLKLF